MLTTATTKWYKKDFNVVKQNLIICNMTLYILSLRISGIPLDLFIISHLHITSLCASNLKQYDCITRSITNTSQVTLGSIKRPSWMETCVDSHSKVLVSPFHKTWTMFCYSLLLFWFVGNGRRKLWWHCSFFEAPCMLLHLGIVHHFQETFIWIFWK